MKKIFKRIFIAIFIALLILPSVVKCIETIGKKALIDANLVGITKNVDLPKMTIETYLKGSFQKMFELYWVNTFPGRKYFILIYNQLRYSLFSLNGSWRQQNLQHIIGNNGSIFHEFYIADALQYEKGYDFSIKENQEKCFTYVKNLERIHDILEHNGKHLLFYITPSKAHFLHNEIPERYLYKKREVKHPTVDGVDFLTSKLHDTHIHWYDSRNDMRNLQVSGIPVFYKTGIHMSRPADQLLTVKLLERMNAISGNQYPQLALDCLNNSATPYWRDQDVYQMLNVVYGIKENVYYQYNFRKLNTLEFPQKTVLVQGTSFAESFEKDFTEQKLGDTCYRIFYKQLLFTNGQPTGFKDWTDLDFKNLIDKSDFILIEVNDAAVNLFNNGFVDYLKQYLENNYVN